MPLIGWLILVLVVLKLVFFAFCGWIVWRHPWVR